MNSQPIEFSPQLEDEMLATDLESTPILSNDESRNFASPISFHGPDATIQPYLHCGINE